MKKIFAEFGLGNETVFSTEIEEGESEYRVPKFLIPKKISEFYLRFWVMKTVLIISSLSGLEVKKKDRYKFKLLFGVGGSDS